MTADDNKLIGRFELIRALGAGSQGSVHLARDPMLDRFVAIKILTPANPDLAAIADDGTPLEGRMSSKLHHPNIVSIYDAGECDEGPYLVFEFVEGDPLADVLQRDGAFTLAKAARLMGPILDAVATAHTAEIIHLDLSPRNILIDKQGVPRVMDFGLSQYVSKTPGDRKMAVGTLRYMAPEHFLGNALGPATDVFALGSTFFELVTGKRAMQGASMHEIQQSILNASVDLGSLKIYPEGEAFARFLSGALERDRAGRYADCTVMKEAFAVFANEAGLTDEVASAGGNHSTIDFLLRRMQRKQDFPTISRTLSDINRLTGNDDGSSSADKLANVILRDFALTTKLLKLVNSAFYGTRATEVTSISQAVVFLGSDQIRMTANSLTFFGHLKGDSAVLKDSMTKSFLSGLIARHLAQRAKLRAAEEAFICGMFQNLGENLAIYYFAEEFEEINELKREKGLEKPAASRGILGVSYAELGAVVARNWKLPDTIIESIRGMPPGPVCPPETEEEKLRDFAVLANEFCDLFLDNTPAEVDVALQMLLERFAPSVELDERFCLKLLDAGLTKLQQFSQDLRDQRQPRAAIVRRRSPSTLR